MKIGIRNLKTLITVIVFIVIYSTIIPWSDWYMEHFFGALLGAYAMISIIAVSKFINNLLDMANFNALARKIVEEDGVVTSCDLFVRGSMRNCVSYCEWLYDQSEETQIKTLGIVLDDSIICGIVADLEHSNQFILSFQKKK